MLTTTDSYIFFSIIPKLNEATGLTKWLVFGVKRSIGNAASKLEYYFSKQQLVWFEREVCSIDSLC